MHGESYRGERTPEYVAWSNMIQRCENSGLPYFHRYGGRGVTVCRAWRESYERFLADVGRRPGPNHSIDRFPDPDGNYEPGNVRWATWQDQQNNRSGNRRITCQGVTRTLQEWSRETGVKRETIARRLDNGRIPEEAMGPPVAPAAFAFNGRTMTVAEISAETGVPINSLWRRLRRHGSADAAIEAWKKNSRGKKNRSKP